MPHAERRGSRVSGLDGLRGLAVLLVVLMHLRLTPFLFGGTVGVTAFFTLSGYLITGILLREKERFGRIDLVAFWYRRALRLLPALFLVLGVVWISEVVQHHGDFWPKARSAILYYANFRDRANEPMEPIGHTWSLSVEEQFYVVWPLIVIGLLAVVGTRYIAGAALALVIASVAWRSWLFGTGESHAVVYFDTFSNAFALLAGCLLAAMLVRCQPTRIPSWFAPAGLVGLVLLATQPGLPRVRFGWQEQLVAVPAAACSLMVIVGCLKGYKTLEWRPLVVVGRVSYGVYLWHGAVFFTLEHHPLAKVLVGIPVTAILVAASWQWVEKPALRLKDRYRRVALLTLHGDNDSRNDPRAVGQPSTSG